MKRFLRNNLIVAVLLNSGNVLNYLFQLIMARSMSPADYGLFNSINSLGVVLAAPAAALPFLFARYTTRFFQESPGRVKSLVAGGMKWFGGLGLLLFTAGAMFMPVLRSYLHVKSYAPLLIILMQLAFSLLFPVIGGVLQGLQRFVVFGLAGSGMTFIRLLTGVVLVSFAGFRVNGALTAGLAGVMGAIMIGWFGLGDIWRRSAVPLPEGTVKNMFKYAVPVTVSCLALIAFGNIDVMLARHFCSPDEAGMYATAAIIGRIGFYLPSVLIFVLFPEAARVMESGGDWRRPFLTSMLLTLLLAGGFALICGFFPEFVIGILYGSDYIPAAGLLRIISISMSFLAVANVVFTNCLAREEYGFITIQFLGVALLAAAVHFFHESPMEIALVLLSAVSFMLFSSLAWMAVEWKKRT